jgi:hypothetical protein
VSFEVRTRRVGKQDDRFVSREVVLHARGADLDVHPLGAQRLGDQRLPSRGREAQDARDAGHLEFGRRDVVVRRGVRPEEHLREVASRREREASKDDLVLARPELERFGAVRLAVQEKRRIDPRRRGRFHVGGDCKCRASLLARRKLQAACRQRWGVGRRRIGHGHRPQLGGASQPQGRVFGARLRGAAVAEQDDAQRLLAVRPHGRQAEGRREIGGVARVLVQRGAVDALPDECRRGPEGDEVEGGARSVEVGLRALQARGPDGRRDVGEDEEPAAARLRVLHRRLQQDRQQRGQRERAQAERPSHVTGTHAPRQRHEHQHPEQGQPEPEPLRRLERDVGGPREVREPLAQRINSGLAHTALSSSGPSAMPLGIFVSGTSETISVSVLAPATGTLTGTGAFPPSTGPDVKTVRPSTCTMKTTLPVPAPRP